MDEIIVAYIGTAIMALLMLFLLITLIILGWCQDMQSEIRTLRGDVQALAERVQACEEAGPRWTVAEEFIEGDEWKLGRQDDE